MKRKIWFSFLLIALSAAMIGGATMAWFTAEANAPAATFKTGTVKVRADEGEEFIATPAEKYFDNVNPGDCATVTWNIVNTGTKAVELKVKLDKAWQGGLDTGNVYYAPRPDSGWVMYKEDEIIWLYYVNGPVPGTYGGTSEAERTVSLPVVVAFDGAATGNEYQNKRFSLTGTVYAIQASNGAPAAEWDPAWTTVKDPDYSDANLKKYFLEGPGKDMDCWPGEEPEPPTKLYQVIVLSSDPDHGGVEGIGDFEVGVEVSAQACPNAGYIFSHWEDERGNTVSGANPYVFPMPAHDVTLIAVFVEELPPVFAEDSLSHNMNAEKDIRLYKTYATVAGTMTALDTNGNAYNGSEKFIVTVTLEGYGGGFGYIQCESGVIPVTLEFVDGEGEVVADAEWTLVCNYPHNGTPSITGVTRVVSQTAE